MSGADPTKSVQRRQPVGVAASLELAHVKEDQSLEAKAAEFEEEKKGWTWRNVPIFKNQITMEHLHRRCRVQTSVFDILDSKGLADYNELQSRAHPDTHPQVDILKRERVPAKGKVVLIVDWQEIEYANPVDPATLGIKANQLI